MRLAVRHGLRLLGDLVAYGLSSGRWWFPALVVVLAVTAVLVATAKAVVPVATYALF